MTEIAAIIDQYAKHGWILRRVIVAPTRIASIRANLPEITIVESANEALWFSRRSLPDREAWELRRLTGSPFALVAVLEDSWSDEEREDALRETEEQMFDGSHPEPTSH